jgi:hypothetical protein
MAYNINKIANTLSVLNREKKSGDRSGPPFQQWKPSLTEDGKSRVYNVRFLPYSDQNEQPFQEVNYYDNKGLSSFRLVAPAQFGLEDPIAELVTELRKQRNNKEAWEVIKGLLPKPRYFAPVFVREEADKGAQVWELSPTVCKDIYGILVSEDYRDEDVTSPEKGFDIQVTVSPSGKTFVQPGTGKVYPVNDLKPIARTKSTPLSKKEEETKKLLSSIPNLLDIFTKMCKPASEMKTMLENYLAVDPKGEGSSSSGTNHTEVADEVVDTATAQSVEDQFAGL